MRLALRRLCRAVMLTGLLPLAAHAVVVRGHVTNAQGVRIPGARVQLVEGGKVVAVAYAGLDGAYELHTGDAGRFTLLTFITGYFPAVGESFYGGATAVVLQDVVLGKKSVREDASAVETGVTLPFALLPMPAALITDDQLASRAGVVDELRLQAGVFVVRTGQWGGDAALYVRGGDADANKVVVDGVAADDVGGRFDFGTVSSTGVASLEVDRGADSALYGSDARAGVVSVRAPRGVSLRPRVLYTGDGGNLHTFRDELSVEGTRRKLDYLAEFSRFDTSNALPNDEFHVATAVANLGYALGSRTLLRGTLRNAVSANGLPGAYDFFDVAQNGKRGDQDVYAQATLEHRSEGNWHNLLRYGVVRKREQLMEFGPVGTLGAGGLYYGKVVTIRGANGYSVTGAAAIANASAYPQSTLAVNDRDVFDYETDAVITRHVSALGGFQYENERGALRGVGSAEQTAQRTNFTLNALVQGDVKTRVFFSLGGALEKNHLYGTRGTPRLGLTYVAVRASDRKFHGTTLHADVSRGVQEPSFAFEFGSLDNLLRTTGNAAAIKAYGVTPIEAEESRTYDVRVDQNILGSKLLVRGGYFHSQFDHGIEQVSAAALQQYFGVATASALLTSAYENSLAYRAQGGELEVQYQPTHSVVLRGGYTFLAPVVERSFTSDALQAQGATTNPALRGLTIGATSPRVGARPFQRAPQTGFVVAEYARDRYALGISGAFAGRSDDSTFLAPALLLPNRDLDHGYAKLDAHVTASVTGRVVVFAQVENLVNDQHIGPVGYPGLPLTVRAGLKVRIGGD